MNCGYLDGFVSEILIVANLCLQEERRIVYIGRISGSTTKMELKKQFERFGEIENVSLHFRETG